MRIPQFAFAKYKTKPKTPLNGSLGLMKQETVI